MYNKCSYFRFFCFLEALYQDWREANPSVMILDHIIGVIEIVNFDIGYFDSCMGMACLQLCINPWSWKISCLVKAPDPGNVYMGLGWGKLINYLGLRCIRKWFRLGEYLFVHRMLLGYFYQWMKPTYVLNTFAVMCHQNQTEIHHVNFSKAVFPNSW